MLPLIQEYALERGHKALTELDKKKRKGMRQSILCLCIVGGIFLVCFVGAALSPYGEYEIFYVDGGMKILKLAPPDLTHVLGTDQDGRDVFTRLLYGGRISISIAFTVVFIQTLIGVTAGIIAGYFGKWVDMIIMRITDIVNSLPDIIIILLLSGLMAAYGISAKYRIFLLMLFLVAFGWTSIARIVRSQVLYVREAPFMMAAELCGIPTWKRFFYHLLPAVMGQVLAAMPIAIGSIVLTEATLSFLGFGLPYPYASWGNMLSSAMSIHILRGAWNVWLPPGIMVTMTVSMFYLLGEGLKKWRASV